MPVAAVAEVGDSIAVKVSSKHQITIPSAARSLYGFGDCALCTFTETGILIEPIEPVGNDDSLTVTLLRHLMNQGFEGEELLSKYEEISPAFLSYARMVQEAEKDFAEGQATSYAVVRDAMRKKHGL